VDLNALILALLQKQPWFGTLVAVIGLSRIVMKPIFSVIPQIIKETPTQADDAWLARFQKSGAYRIGSFVVDFLFSVKLPQMPKD